MMQIFSPFAVHFMSFTTDLLLDLGFVRLIWVLLDFDGLSECGGFDVKLCIGRSGHGHVGYRADAKRGRLQGPIKRHEGRE